MAIVRKPEQYFVSTQYNWTGELTPDGKKIAGTSPEMTVRGLHHPKDDEAAHKDPFSFIDFTVFAHCTGNPVRFNTIKNVANITAGSGIFKIHDKEVTIHRIQAGETIIIPPGTTYTFENDTDAPLKGVMISTPPWFQEDEECNWDLVETKLVNN